MTFIAKLGIYFILLITISGSFSLDFFADPSNENIWTGACSEGRAQSPIDIPNRLGRTFLSHMEIDFFNMREPITDVKVTNGARQTIFEWNRSVERSVVIKTTKDVLPFQPYTEYILQNVHIHHSTNNQTGTIHFIEGQSYAMEMHFLWVLRQFNNNASAAFAAGPGNALEIAVLWKLSTTNNPAWTLLNDLMFSKQLKEGEKITSGLSIRLSDFIPKGSTYTFYHGSLPAVRCAEVISWIIFDRIMELDTKDFGMRHWTYISNGKEVPLDRNTRRIQPLNGRKVYQGWLPRVSYREGTSGTSGTCQPNAGLGGY